MELTGIWIDKKEAKVISIKGNAEQIQVIDSNIESYNIKGGSGTKVKGGPQDVVQDSKYLEREKHQMKSFFEEIVPSIEKAETVVIFGPAQMGSKLHKELSENHSTLSNKVKSVEKADSMTDKQLIAWVKTYFKTN